MKTIPNMERGEPGAGRPKGKSRLALLVLCVYWLTIFILSHLPKDYVPSGWKVSGKFHHLGAYVVLTFLVFLNAGLIRNVSLRFKKTWLMIGVVIAYGALDEFLQAFIPGRRGSPRDWAVDVIACLLCVGMLLLSQRLWPETGPQGK